MATAKRMAAGVKKIIFAHHEKKRQALLFERSEFKCLAFYPRQKLFLAGGLSVVVAMSLPLRRLLCLSAFRADLWHLVESGVVIAVIYS